MSRRRAKPRVRDTPPSEEVAESHTPGRQLTDAERLDERLAVEALAKRRDGRSLNREDQAALKRAQKRREEELRWRYYASIPQKHWVQMSGRQPKVLLEQAVRYGLPLDGRTIDLRRLARGLHDFLASIASQYDRLKQVGDELLAGAVSPSQERYRAARAGLAELELQERLRHLVQVGVIERTFDSFASILRRAAERLEVQFGKEARAVLDQAMDESERIIERQLAQAPAPELAQNADGPLLFEKSGLPAHEDDDEDDG